MITGRISFGGQLCAIDLKEYLLSNFSNNKYKRISLVRFADDYIEMLQKYGSVSCGGHELTGLSNDEELDVVKVTLKNLERNQNIMIPLYVLEETQQSLFQNSIKSRM